MLTQLDDTEVINNVEKEILGIFMPRLLSMNSSLSEKRKYKKKRTESTNSSSSEVNLKKQDVYETIINNRVLFDQILSIENKVINQCIDLFKQYFLKENCSLLGNLQTNCDSILSNNNTCGFDLNSIMKAENQFEFIMFKELLTGTLFFNNLVAINKHFSLNTQLASNDLKDYFYNSSLHSDDLISKVMHKFYEELKNLLIGNTNK